MTFVDAAGHNFLYATCTEAWVANGLVTLMHCTERNIYEFVSQASRSRCEEFAAAMGRQVKINL